MAIISNLTRIARARVYWSGFFQTCQTRLSRIAVRKWFGIGIVTFWVFVPKIASETLKATCVLLASLVTENPLQSFLVVIFLVACAMGCERLAKSK